MSGSGTDSRFDVTFKCGGKQVRFEIFHFIHCCQHKPMRTSVNVCMVIVLIPMTRHYAVVWDPIWRGFAGCKSVHAFSGADALANVIGVFEWVFCCDNDCFRWNSLSTNPSDSTFAFASLWCQVSETDERGMVAKLNDVKNPDGTTTPGQVQLPSLTWEVS